MRKIWNATKLKAFADDKINVAQMMISNFSSEEKILREKEKMLITSIFSFFHKVFYSMKDI